MFVCHTQTTVYMKKRVVIINRATSVCIKTGDACTQMMPFVAISVTDFHLTHRAPAPRKICVQGNESLECDGPHVNVCGVAICYKQKKSDQKLNRLNFRPRI